MTSLVAIVAAISRRSGCVRYSSPGRVEHATGEVRAQLALHEGVVGHRRLQHVLAQRELREAHQHRQLGPREPPAGAPALGDLLGGGQELERPVERPVGLEGLHQRLVRLEAVARDGLLLAQDLHLQVVVVEHLGAHVVRQLGEQRVARLGRQRAALDGQIEQDLEVDLVVGAVDAGRVVDGVGVDLAAGERVLDAARLRGPEVAALGDDAGAQLAAVDPDRVVRAVAHLVVRLVGRLDERPDAAVPEQVDRRAQDRLADLGRRHRDGADPQRGAHLGRQVDRLRAAGEDATPRREHGRVVVGPGGGGAELVQALPLDERARGVRARIEEHVAVVEGADQPDLIRPQHPVAEDVARHVADADDRERLALGVVPELAEVPAHALPGAAGGDAERLVVVAGRAAGRERVAEPEAVLDGDRVRGVRERRRALVGGDDEVGVVAVVDAHARGMHDRARHHRVRHVEQPADQGRVLPPHLLAQLVPPARRALQHEPALAAVRHDHGVLDHLGLHQPEHLGAVVLAPVRPADAAARDEAATQVDALHLGIADEDLEERRRGGHRRDVGRAQLQAQAPSAIGPVGVGADGREHELQEAAQDAVLVEARHGVDALR